MPTKIDYLHCHNCGKQVSSGYIAMPTEDGLEGLVVRAWIECPECIEKREKEKEDANS